MIRSVLAVVAGLLLAVLILFAATRISVPLPDNPSGALRDPHAWLAVGYAILATAAGSYVCAWVARRAELQHANVLGMLLVLAAILLMQTGAWHEPRWYQFTMAGCAPLSALIGAHARLLTKRPAIH